MDGRITKDDILKILEESKAGKESAVKSSGSQ